MNVAYKRPAFQSSLWGRYRATNAVDGDWTGRVEHNSCAQTKRETNPWWGVDLGKSVWVETVLIASATSSKFKELSNVEIRIGKKSNHWLIMLCNVWFIHVPKTFRKSDGLGTGNRTLLSPFNSLLGPNFINSPQIGHMPEVEPMKPSYGRTFHPVILLFACVLMENS